MNSWPTITTPPAHLGLVTPDHVRGETGDEDSGDNVQVFRDILAVSAQIDTYLKRPLARATISEQFDIDGYEAAESLWLNRYPVTSITSASENGSALVASDYKLDGVAGMVYRRYSNYPARWICPPVVIVYVGGFLLPGDSGYQEGGTGSVPADIQKAAALACAALAEGRGRDSMVRSETIPGVIEQQYWVGTDPGQGMSGLPAESERLLAPYRAPR